MRNAIPISQAPKHFPGKPPHICTLYRWMQKGVRGCRLETFSVGMKRYVTQEAIDAFVARTTAAAPHSDLAMQAKTSRSRHQSIAQAEREFIAGQQ